MFAVLKTGGKQYKVSRDDVIVVEKLSVETGDLVQLENILMVSDKEATVGLPNVQGAAVRAEVISQGKDKKVVSFVKRRRKHSSKRTKGHRQKITVLRIKEILISGAKTTGKPIETGVSVVGSANLKTDKTSVQKKLKKLTKSEEPASTEKKADKGGSQQYAEERATRKVEKRSTKEDKSGENASEKKSSKSASTKSQVNKKTKTSAKAVTESNALEKEKKVKAKPRKGAVSKMSTKKNVK